MESVGGLLRRNAAGLFISKQRLRRSESIQLVPLKRECRDQELGYSSRPFVLCGLPVKRPAKGVLLHERRNGKFLLQVTGHPSHGLPWGQDRLVPIFLATLAARQKSPRVRFSSAADLLDTFGLQQGGSQYQRLVVASEADIRNLRYGHATEPSGGRPSSPIQLHGGGMVSQIRRRIHTQEVTGSSPVAPTIIFGGFKGVAGRTIWTIVRSSGPAGPMSNSSLKHETVIG